jgi:DNA mismatch endonuclease (patch repair protein)
LEGNKARDAANQAKLREMGWGFLILWECQLKNETVLTEKIRNFLEGKADD